MADIWMDVDAALSEVPVNILPLLDDTDFKTIETAIVYNSAGLTLYWHFVTPAGAYTVTQVTPTTGGDYDWSGDGTDPSGMYTIEIPASAGASINNNTEGFGWFTGVATGVLPWRGPVIGFRAAGLNDALIESAWSATRGLSGTALPAAAADAAGGLPISDAGGLDLDTLNSRVSTINSNAAEIPNLFNALFQKVSRITGWAIVFGSSDSFPHAAGTSGIEIRNSLSAFVWDEGQSNFGEWDINTEVYTDQNPGAAGYISLAGYLWGGGTMADDVVLKLTGTFEYGALPSYIYVAIPAGWDGTTGLVGVDGRLYGGHKGEKGGPSPSEVIGVELDSTALKTTTTLADADVLTANSILDHLRKASWMIYNKLSVVDATGAYTLTKDDGSTTAATGTITDDSTTTVRSAPSWA